MRSRRRVATTFTRSSPSGCAARPTSERSPSGSQPTCRSSSTCSPPRRSAQRSASIRELTAPVHGLLQDYHVEYREDDATIAWRRTPRHGNALPLRGCEELTEPPFVAAGCALERDLCGRHRAGRRRHAARDRARARRDRSGASAPGSRGERLGSDSRPEHGHRVLRPRGTSRPARLPDRPLARRRRSRSATGSPSRRARWRSSRPCSYRCSTTTGFPAEGRHAVAVLDQLRSLSGRLALKLISAPSQRAEALGLALSRMYLEHQGAFQSQVVVPLDAHLELYRSLKQLADELGDDVSFKRTDLGIFDLERRGANDHLPTGRGEVLHGSGRHGRLRGAQGPHRHPDRAEPGSSVAPLRPASRPY